MHSKNYGRFLREIRHLFDEVEQRRLAPLQIVEHDHEGLLLCFLLEQLPEGPGDPVRRGSLLRLAEQRAKWRSDGLARPRRRASSRSRLLAST